MCAHHFRGKANTFIISCSIAQELSLKAPRDYAFLKQGMVEVSAINDAANASEVRLAHPLVSRCAASQPRSSLVLSLAFNNLALPTNFNLRASSR